MAKARQRREGDRHWFVEMRDAVGNTRTVAVGNYWAPSESEAVKQATKEYPGLFSSLETRNWQAVATQKPVVLGR